MIEVSTDSTKLTSDTIELVDNINPVVSTENSAYMEVNPTEYTLSSGGLFAGGKLNGTIPTWLTAAIDAEIQTGGSIANIIGPMQNLIDNLEVGVAQNISSINTTNTSINSRIDTVVSEVGANRAIDLAVVATKVTDAEATAIAVNQIGATFGGNVDAYITSITSAYATANLAYAEDVDLVSATLGATTATVTSHDYAIVTTIPANLTAVETALTASITDLQNQVDGSISTWFYSGSPEYSSDDTTPALLSDSADTGAELITNSLVFDLITDQMYKFLDTDELNTDLTTEVYDDILRWEAVYKLVLPESDWVTLDNNNANDLEKTAHLGDIYYDIDTGFGYRYAQLDIADTPDQGVTFTWVAITDAIALQALQSAAAAQASADGKATVYLKTASQIAIIVAAWTAQEVIDNIGDLWINTIDGVTKSWNGVDTWLDTTNTQTVQTLLDIITLDGAISTEESARVADVLAVQAAALAETATRVSAEANLDGLITAEEADRIAAIEAVSDAYKEYSRVVTLAISDGVLTPAEQALISSAQTEVDLANARFTAIEVDSTQALTWSAGASKFVTDPYGVITGWSFSSSSDEPSIFKVNSESFELIDSLNNRAVMTSDGLAFYKSGVDSPYKMVSKIETGVAENNSLVTLSGFYNTPSVIVSQNSILSYKADYSSQNQKWVVRAQNLTGSTITGNWTFTPLAQLILDDATKSESLSSSDNSSSDTIYSSYYQTPLETEKISVTGYINSSRSTGTSGEYYKRKCVVTLQTSSDASSWADKISSTIYFGSDLSQDYFSLFKDVTQGQYYYRVKFIYSDDTGTFSVGASYNYYTRTVTQPTTNLVVDVQTSGPTFEADSMTCSYNLLPNESVMSGTYSYNWNTAYIRAFASYSSFGGSSYTEALVYNSINGKGFSNYNVNHGKMMSASSTGTDNIERGVSIGYKSSDTTSTSFSVIAESKTTGYSGSGDVQVTISNMTLTLNTKIPVTSSTTANNYFGALNASYELGTTTYLDENGILNYLAIG